MPFIVPLIPAILGAAEIIGATLAAWLTIGASVGVGLYQMEKAQKQQRQARDAYNASLQDRLLILRSAISERRYVLGTVRTSGTLLYGDTVGNNRTALDMVVALACNKCELTDYYFNDERTPLAEFPGDHYGQQQEIDAEESFSVVGQTGTVNLSARPKDGTPIKALRRGIKNLFTQEVDVTLAPTGTQLSYSGMPNGTNTLLVSYKIEGSTRIRATFKDGDPNQTATSWADHPTPRWTEEHLLKGVAHVRSLMLWDENLFPAGPPVVSAVLKGGWVDGHPFFDPRTSTNPLHTDNPALLAAWWMTLPRNRGGMGIPTDWIDWDSVSTAANICDELVTVKTLDGLFTQQIKRYQCHTVLSTAAPPAENLDVILSSMAGRKCFTAGKYRILAGAFRSATKTITDADVIGTKSIRVVTVSGDNAPPNIVTATFADATKNWQETSAKAVRNAGYITADGHEEPFDTRLPATTDPRQANYLMGVMLESLRPAFGITLTVGGFGEDIALYDTVQVNLTNRSTYASKTYEVLKITDHWNGEFDLLLAEIRPQTWALNPNTWTPADPVTQPDLTYLWNVPPITGFNVEPGTPQTLPDGNAVSVLTLSWNAVTDPYVIEAGYIEVRYRIPGTEWITLPPLPGDATGTTMSASLADGGLYQFQAWAVNGIGAASRQKADFWLDISGAELAEGIQGPGLFTWANPIGVDTTSSSITKSGFSPLTNGGFESGTSAGWGGAFQATVVTGNSRTGTFCARIPTVPGGPNIISDKWAVTPGQVWALSAHVKRDESALPTGPITLRVRSYNSSQVEINGTGLHSSSASVSGYQALAGNFTVPAGVAFIALDVGESQGSGAWFVDDCAASPATWDAGAHSLQSYSTGCFCTARPANTTTTKMFGLNNDPDVDVNFTGINFAWRADANGACAIYENGILIGNQGLYTAATIFAITYDGANVRYQKDGVVVRTVAAAGLRLFLDVSLFTLNASWHDVAFGPQGAAGADGIAGAAAQAVRINASAYVFTYNQAGSPAPAGQSITFTANRQNIVAAAAFSSTPSVALTGSGDTRTLSIANFAANQSVRVRVDAAGFFDEVTVVRLQQGATGPSAVVGILTNEAHTLAADAEGTVGTFAGASGLFMVFEGLVDRTSVTTFSIVSASNCTAQINTATNTPVAGQPRGFYRVTAVTADQASVTLRAVFNGVTVDKLFSVTRARQGAPGEGANLLRVDEWVVGTNGNQGTHWASIGNAAESGIVLGGAGTAPLGPLGITEPLWEARSLDDNAPINEPDGGWEYGAIPVDHAKTYRSTCWFRINQISGNLYFGCDTGGQTSDLGGGANLNPYFVGNAWAAYGLEANQWYLAVGLIHGSGYAGGYSGIAGIYDPRTGKKINVGTEYRNTVGATVQRHRAYHFYDTLTTTRQWMGRPRFEEVNGNEPSIYDLMGIRLPVPWIERGNCFAALSTFYKLGGVLGWDSDILSIQSFTNCHVQIRPGQTSGNFMVGLNTDPYANQSYETIDFAWYCHPGGLQIYENGVQVGDFGTYTTATELAITYDGVNVRYYKDRVHIRTVAVAGARFYLDSSFYSPNASCAVKWGPGTTFETIGSGELEPGAATTIVTGESKANIIVPIISLVADPSANWNGASIVSASFTAEVSGMVLVSWTALVNAGPSGFYFAIGVDESPPQLPLAHVAREYGDVFPSGIGTVMFSTTLNFLAVAGTSYSVIGSVTRAFGSTHGLQIKQSLMKSELIKR